MSRERGIERHFASIINTEGVRIIIPPQLPLLNENRLTDNQFQEVVSFCREREKQHSPDELPPHRRATEAIKKSAKIIYQGFFLLPDEVNVSIHAFSEVRLKRRATVDCIIIGPLGAVLVEIKKKGGSSSKQLQRYEDAWQGLFPEVPVLTLRASYIGDEITVRKHSS